MFKALVFDLDDTLYDERSFVMSGFREVSLYVESQYEINHQKFLEVLIEYLNKYGRGKLFDLALEKFGIYETALVNKLVNVYRSHTPIISTYPGVKALLRYYRKKGKKIVMITDGSYVVQKSKMKALGLTNMFDLIVYTDYFGERFTKPSLLPYKLVLEKFNMAGKEAIYIGDNPYKDFIAANKLGFLTIRINQGAYKDIVIKQNDKYSNAIYSIDSILQMKKFLESNFPDEKKNI